MSFLLSREIPSAQLNVGFGVRGSLIAISISAVLYGLALTMSAVCVHLLAKSEKIYDSKCKVVFLSVYIAFMLGCSTEGLISELYLTITTIQHTLSTPMSTTTVNLLPIALPLAVWGADGFLIWRCLILYKGVTLFKRVILYTFLGSVALVKLICGCVFFYYIGPAHASNNAGQLLRVQLLVLSSTTAGNVLVSSLISARLLYANRVASTLHSLDNDLGQSPYMKALIICVESSGLIAAVALIGVIATIKLPHEYSQIIPMILPHLCVISPLLIVYRISQGRKCHLDKPDNTLPQLPISFKRATSTTATSANTYIDPMSSAPPSITSLGPRPFVNGILIIQ